MLNVLLEHLDLRLPQIGLWGDVEQLIKDDVGDVVFFVPLEHRFVRFLLIAKTWVEHFFFHPLMGWILTGEGLHHDAAVLTKYVPDLCRDRVHVFLSTWHWISNVIVGIGLLVFGGIPYVLWGIFFRTTFGLHCTWLVNSATHIWGSRRFTTRDDSTNNWWVALITFGEGWHNNHHAHPVSARHGRRFHLAADITVDGENGDRGNHRGRAHG